MTFLVHRAERADRLVEGLAAQLQEPWSEDPFARELVLVPARGVERWLSQRLAHHLGAASGHQDGVCAAVEFRNPRTLIETLLGVDADPWSAAGLMWPMLRALDRAVDAPWGAVLAEHLGQSVADAEEAELRRGRRLAVARRLSRIFAGYLTHRPAMLADWEAGGASDGGGLTGSDDPAGELSADLDWQPHLWREVVADVARVSGLPSPLARHREVRERLLGGEIPAELPGRINLFGHTLLGIGDLELLAALGAHRDVHLWLPDASRSLWQVVANDPPGGWRTMDRSHRRIDHPLVASMGRDLREGLAALQAAGAVDGPALPEPAWPASLLGRLQADIAGNRSLAEIATSPVPADASVQVHACHGPARQVEVLREVILGLLEDDESLQPRDIVVMCPDIEQYAPLLTAAFGLGEAVSGSHPGSRLRIMLADRAPQQSNPLLGVLTAVLELADGRAEASRVLDLLAIEPVRRRFRFSETDLETLHAWVEGAGIRWAWDAASRERFDLAAFPQNTWHFGLDRLLLGVAMAEEPGRWVGSALPLDDVSTTDIALAGRFAEAVERIQGFAVAGASRRPAAEWLAFLADGVSGLADVARGEDWQLAQLRRELGALGEAAGSEVDLGLADVRALLSEQFAGRPSRSSFRTGALTLCTMTPMRSVPHRVVCLLGIDDGVFPRGGTVDGDDILGRSPRVGEPSRRSADRQLFLDAVMAATDTLVITYTGFSEVTGAERPPSVALREFLDVVEATVAPGSGAGSGAEPVIVRAHRSQSFHADYLASGDPAHAFSFDPAAVAAAAAASATRARPKTLAAQPVPRPDLNDDVHLGDLVDAVVSPVRFFLSRRLQIDLSRDNDPASDRIPVELGGLARWQIGERLLTAILSGVDPATAREAEWRRGTLPPGRYGWRLAGELLAAVVPIAEQFEAATQGQTMHGRDLDLALPDGRRLVGSITDLYGDRLIRCGFARVGARQRASLWVAQVALSAASDSTVLSRVIGRASEGDAVQRATYGAVEDPQTVLASLIAFHDDALTRVLPYGVETARLLARTATTGRPEWMVRRDRDDCWRTESAGAEFVEAFGKRPSWDDVVAACAEHHHGPSAEQLAQTIWGPILAAEVE